MLDNALGLNCANMRLTVQLVKVLIAFPRARHSTGKISAGYTTIRYESAVAVLSIS